MHKTSAHLIIVLLGIILVQGQNYEQLLKKKEFLINESNTISQILEETQSTQSQTLEQLSIVNEKINIQESLLLLLEKEVDILIHEQEQLQSALLTTESRLQLLKKNYRTLLKQTHHISRSYNRLLFFLSSNNFNQLVRRVYHLKQIEQTGRQHFENIQQTQIEIETKKKQIINKKIKQREVAFKKKQELVLLSKSRISKQKTISFLENKEDSLNKALLVKQKETKNITNAIMLILEKQKENEKLTPELTLISKNFFENKGRLPWPVKKGSIISRFGEVPHPVLSGITTMNNGVEIATNDKYVRSVFEGEVTKIIVLPNGLKVVIIRHGIYLTVYSNLLETDVLKGQKIKTKQIIGILYDNEKKERNVIGFQIWHDREKLNPTHWLTGY